MVFIFCNFFVQEKTMIGRPFLRNWHKVKVYCILNGRGGRGGFLPAHNIQLIRKLDLGRRVPQFTMGKINVQSTETTNTGECRDGGEEGGEASSHIK